MTMRAWAMAVVLAVSAGCGRTDRQPPEAMRQQIAALEAERDTLRGRLNDLLVNDRRMDGMPDTPVRIGVPTSLARDLVQRVLTGFVDQVTLELNNLRVRKRGTIRRVIPIGDYDLQVTVNRVTGTLTTGTPDVTFGGDAVAVALPLTVAKGSGRATVRFQWDGRNVAGAVCGDMDVTQIVTGTVRPRTYQVSAGLALTATDTEILAQPRIPRLRVNLGVVPSAASWQAAQKILDDKGGVCGFVLERVDVLGHVGRLIDKGFNVRLPTEKVRAAALPVGVEPTLMVRGQPVALDISVGGLAITEHALWLGARVPDTRCSPPRTRRRG
jgi:hypothetical protein